MADEPGFPVTMHHPQHKPAEIRQGDLANAWPGQPERFPPVEVHSAAQEGQFRARGYLRYGESMAEAVEFLEYPKMLRHRDEVEPTPPTVGAKLENGQLVQFAIPGKPGSLLPVVANNPEEEAKWVAKGYQVPTTFDPDAYERAKNAPGEPGDEWPKAEYDDDGKLIRVEQDPDAPRDLSREYPKWLHFANADSVLVNTPAEEARVLATRHTEPADEPQPAKPYVDPAPQPAKQTDPDYAEFLAWKASRAAPPVSPPPSMVDQINEERATLIQLAEESGIEIDKRWGIERLRRAVMGEEAAD